MNQGYRDFSKQERAYKNFLTQLPKGFEVRVQVDNTTQEFVLKNTPAEITVIHFNCPEFREGEGHTGTFGTFPRFLPLFEKDLELVWVTDIDVIQSYLNPKIAEKTPDAMIHTYICQERKVYGTQYTILAGSFISRIQFPRALFTRFLTKLKDGQFQSTVDALNEANRRKPEEKVCPYGMDEYFMNTSIQNWLKDRTFDVLIWKEYSVNPTWIGATEKEANLMRTFQHRPSKDLFQKIREIYRKRLPAQLEEYPCLRPTWEKLDSFKSGFDEFTVIPSANL